MNLNEGLLTTVNRGRGRNVQKAKLYNIITVQKGYQHAQKKSTPKKSLFDSTTESSTEINWRNHDYSRITASTPNFSNTSNITIDQGTQIILAITEGRGDATCEVGLAAINIIEPHLILCQISDTQSYCNVLTKINLLNPIEIIIPNTMLTSRLTEKLKEKFEDVRIIAVPRITFNKANGLQFVRKLCAPAWNSIFLVLQYKYYALTAASALLTYTETHLYKYYAKESIKVEYQELEGFTSIDVFTADKLELVACALPDYNSKFSSLYGILNHCVTKIGARTLRASILQPPCFVPDIEERLDCVEELVMNPAKIASIQTLLKQISNIGQLLTLATVLPEQAQNCSARQLNYILLLNSLFDLIEPLKELWVDTNKPFFMELRNTLSCEEFSTLKILVRAIIQPHARPASGEQGIFERCFSIKPGVNELLDLIRKIYSEKLDAMREYVKSLGEKYNLDLKLSNTNKKWYHIVLTLNPQQRRTFKKSDLPEEFIQVQRLTTMVTMKTIQILTFSSKLEDITTEILKISNILIYNLLIEVRKRIGLFYKLCEDIAKLDMLQSLAQASSSNHKYVRPKFGQITEILNSRHPLLDFICETEPVSNDIHASPEYNMHIITGPNGSGKSIFIRQVVLLQVMAQVGCFVPATSAIFRVADRILARIYLEDNMNAGASAFVLEMKEIQYFLQVITDNTLIIIDELCRSTSVNEGTALAMAICEKFLSTKAFTYFTTHYIFITKLWDMNLNVKCWQLEAKELDKGDRKILKFTYNVLPGVNNMEGYAIYLARASWPKDVISYVEEFLKILKPEKKDFQVDGIDPRIRLKYDLESEFKILKYKRQLSREIIQEKLLKYTLDLEKFGHSFTLDDITSNSSFVTTLQNSQESFNITDSPPQCQDANLAKHCSDEASSSLKYANDRSTTNLCLYTIDDDNRISDSPRHISQAPAECASPLKTVNNTKLSILEQSCRSYLYPEVVYSNTTSLDDDSMEFEDIHYGLIPQSNREEEFESNPSTPRSWPTNNSQNLIEIGHLNFTNTPNSSQEERPDIVFTPVNDYEGSSTQTNKYMNQNEMFANHIDNFSRNPVEFTIAQIHREDVPLPAKIFEETMENRILPTNSIQQFGPRHSVIISDLEDSISNINFQEFDDGIDKSLNEIHFSMPLRYNPQRTSTPIHPTKKPALFSYKGDDVVFKKPTPRRQHTEENKINIEKAEEFSQKEDTSLSKKNIIAEIQDLDVSEILEDLQNHSKSFIDDWLPENKLETTLQVPLQSSGTKIKHKIVEEDVEIMDAIDDLASCSASFEEDWDLESSAVLAKKRKRQQIDFHRSFSEKARKSRTAKEESIIGIKTPSEKKNPEFIINEPIGNKFKLKLGEKHLVEKTTILDENINKSKITFKASFGNTEIKMKESQQGLANADTILKENPKIEVQMTLKESLVDSNIALEKGKEYLSRNDTISYEDKIKNELPMIQEKLDNNDATSEIGEKYLDAIITQTQIPIILQKKLVHQNTILEKGEECLVKSKMMKKSKDVKIHANSLQTIYDSTRPSYLDKSSLHDFMEDDSMSTKEIFNDIDEDLTKINQSKIEHKATDPQNSILTDFLEEETMYSIMNEKTMDATSNKSKDLTGNIEIKERPTSKLSKVSNISVYTNANDASLEIAIIEEYNNGNGVEKIEEASPKDFLEEHTTKQEVIAEERYVLDDNLEDEISYSPFWEIDDDNSRIIEDLYRPDDDQNKMIKYPSKEGSKEVSSEKRSKCVKINYSKMDVDENNMDEKNEVPAGNKTNASFKRKNSKNDGTYQMQIDLTKKARNNSFDSTTDTSGLYESLNNDGHKSNDTISEVEMTRTTENTKSTSPKDFASNEAIGRSSSSSGYKINILPSDENVNNSSITKNSERNFRPSIIEEKSGSQSKTFADASIQNNVGSQMTGEESRGLMKNQVLKMTLQSVSQNILEGQIEDFTLTTNVLNSSHLKSPESSKALILNDLKADDTFALQSQITKERSSTQTVKSTDMSVENNVGSQIGGEKTESILKNLVSDVESPVCSSIRIDDQTETFNTNRLTPSSRLNSFRIESSDTSKPRANNSNIFEDNNADFSFTILEKSSDVKKSKILKTAGKRFKPPFVKSQDVGTDNIYDLVSKRSLGVVNRAVLNLTKEDFIVRKNDDRCPRQENQITLANSSTTKNKEAFKDDFIVRKKDDGYTRQEDRIPIANRAKSKNECNVEARKKQEGFIAPEKNTIHDIILQQDGAKRGIEKISKPKIVTKEVISKNFSAVDREDIDFLTTIKTMQCYTPKTGTIPKPAKKIDFDRPSGSNVKISKLKQNKNDFPKLENISKTELHESILRQDMQMIEGNKTLEDYRNEILNRPSARQLQGSKQLVVARKDGTVFVPKSVPQKTKRQKYVPPLKQHITIGKQFDATFFSDENVEIYDAFMSTKNDSDFDFSKSWKNNGNATASCSKFNVDAINVTPKLFCFDHSSTVSKQNSGRNVDKDQYRFCTPEGYFKENKDEVIGIMNKYLNK